MGLAGMPCSHTGVLVPCFGKAHFAGEVRMKALVVAGMIVLVLVIVEIMFHPGEAPTFPPDQPCEPGETRTYPDSC